MTEEVELQFLKARRRYADNLKRLVLISITISTMAAVGTVIIVPVVYFYIQRLESSLSPDLQMCRVEADRLWREFGITEDSILDQSDEQRKQHHKRYAREYIGTQEAFSRIYYQRGRSSTAYSLPQIISPPAPRRSIAQQQYCCGCGVGPPGDPGTIGPPGDAGE